MNRNRMNLKLFEADTNIIDRSGAESLIPIQESNEIIQGTIAQSAVLSRGRKLANMTNNKAGMGQEIYHRRRNCGNCSDSRSCIG